MVDVPRSLGRTGWSRGAKRWIALGIFCVVVVAAGIYIFANPPSSNANRPQPADTKTSTVITVPGTPAAGLSLTRGFTVRA
jgi:hypothetical protein